MIRVKKNGMSDAELLDHIELLQKALDPQKRIKANDEASNPAMRTIYSQADKAFDKLISGVIEDVTGIIHEGIRNSK